jgi:hypothetical protein
MSIHQSNSKKSPKPRSQIEIVRVRYWYEGVRIRSGCTQAKQVERIFGPHEDPKFHEKDPPGKWNRYKLGKTTPQLPLINIVDNEIKGSAREINHPIWELLGLKDEGMSDIDDWLCILNSKVLAIVFRSKRHYFPDQPISQPFSAKLCCKLVALGSLDSLTALTIYWHDTRQKKQIRQAQVLARSIYKVLLIMGESLRLRGLDEAFFDLFKVNVFERTNWGTHLFATPSYQYIQGIYWLSRIAEYFKDQGLIHSLEDKKILKHGVLYGKYGQAMQEDLDIHLANDTQDF